jgi:3-deoxy-7-phosphoheptulonate synthase
MAEELLVTAGAGQTRQVVVGSFARFGAATPIVIAGPCSVESERQIQETAQAVAAAGGHMLRGGAFKPRTSPYAFQGLGAEGLRYLRSAGRSSGLPVVTEVLDAQDVGLVAEHADMLQIGARSMQNFTLLRAAGRSGRPVLLKRAAGATVDEWIHAAEYILAEGNDQVVLCERGIRSFEPCTRATLDLAGAAAARQRTSLPVIADPSHATGRRDLVAPMARAAIGAGLDGVIVEVHPDPDRSVSDAAQTISTEEFARLMLSLHLPPRSADLVHLRDAVDSLDEAIFGLISQRMALSSHIGDLKRRHGMPVHQPAREEDILRRLAGRGQDALPPAAVTAIWTAILAASRARQGYAARESR